MKVLDPLRAHGSDGTSTYILNECVDILDRPFVMVFKYPFQEDRYHGPAEGKMSHLCSRKAMEKKKD